MPVKILTLLFAGMQTYYYVYGNKNFKNDFFDYHR